MLCTYGGGRYGGRRCDETTTAKRRLTEAAAQTPTVARDADARDASRRARGVRASPHARMFHRAPHRVTRAYLHRANHARALGCDVVSMDGCDCAPSSECRDVRERGTRAPRRPRVVEIPNFFVC
tara:strand:- start:2328 stop:2702 length:375 start_codon:yes stop_codon:yes gene_type:complete